MLFLLEDLVELCAHPSGPGLVLGKFLIAVSSLAHAMGLYKLLLIMT